MPNIADIQKDRQFYNNFGTLIDALKGIAIAQFQALEKKIVSFEDFMKILESFFEPLDLTKIHHPFLNSHQGPEGILAITSDRGFLGGLNHRVMVAAISHLKTPKNRLIVIGFQGQKIAQGYKIPCKTITGINDEQWYHHAVEIRDHIVDEVLSGNIGSIKAIYPFAISLKIQQVGESVLLPPTEWSREGPSEDRKEPPAPVPAQDQDLLLETDPADLVEYLSGIWLAQRIYDLLQISRLAEFAARTIHLEECGQKIKDIDKKLQLKYFRARHEVIDQQMRELFAARSMYAE